MLPNFTAADGMRILGIGRNEYIDIVTRCHTKGWFRRPKGKSNVRDLLPGKPIRVFVEHWWLVCVGYVTEEDVKTTSESEHRTIDLLIERGPIFAGMLEYETIQSLYAKGLVYLDVPVFTDDYISGMCVGMRGVC